MQGATSIVPGPVIGSPRAITSSTLSTGSKPDTSRHSESLGLKSSLFGGDVASSRLQVSPTSHHEARKGNAFQVRATTSPKNLASGLLSLLEGIIKPAEKQDQSVVYTGIATIEKKRISVGNLLKADLVDVGAATEDSAAELAGKKIQLQLISVDLDAATQKPKLSPTTTVEGWLTTLGDLDGVADTENYSVTFKVSKDFGEPGAFVIKSYHPNEFFLKSLTLEGDDKSKIDFLTLAWIHPHERYPKDRVFFSTKLYLPSATPGGLQAVREQELQQSRGDGTGMREPWDRIYDYDVYNDIGEPDSGSIRPVLGGSADLPYPRRVRTGRPMSKADPKSESRLKFAIQLPYIPSDEFFLRTKNSTFIAGLFKGVLHDVLPAIKSVLGDKYFSSFKDIDNLYKDGLPIRVPSSILSSDLTPEVDSQRGSLVFLNDIFVAKGGDKSIINYPVPQVYETDHMAWAKDEEYGRQTLAGLNPLVIERLQEYPPKSTLDPAVYGQATSLTEQHILPYLEGLTVAQAIEQKKLFTVDYHDAFLPFIDRANADTKRGFKCYAPRTIFFHSSKGQMKPVAIELSLPPTTKGGNATNTVFTPADEPDHRWLLAKLHATAIDSSFHQVLSHFTYTHGSVEPFIIASNRQLSKMHPIRTLLQPHFKDTMAINAAAREILINAGGVIETAFSLGVYSMTIGSTGYGALWQFDTQGVPQNLISRGMAEPADESYPGSVKLVVEDYPWAKDGLDVWDALHKWTTKYCSIVYNGSDDAVKADEEIQAWWKEIVNVGHGDKKDAPWWPKPDSIASLAQIVSTIAWVAGPLHASLNFGQFAYSGYPPNKPTGTRRFIPEKNTADYTDLQKDPEKFILTTMNTSSQATSVLTVLELLATHSVDEEYFGSLSMSTDWSTNPEVEAAFREFSDRAAALADNIKQRNKDQTLINRSGPAKVPYTLLFPTSTTGLTGQGVPYSVSI